MRYSPDSRWNPRSFKEELTKWFRQKFANSSRNFSAFVNDLDHFGSGLHICVVHCRHDQHGLRRFREIFAETSQDTRRFTNFWRIFHVFFAKFRQNYADISWVFRENFASLAKFSRNVLQMFVSVSWKFHEIFAKCSSNVRECFVSVSWDLRKLFYKCTLQMYPRAEVA